MTLWQRIIHGRPPSALSHHPEESDPRPSSSLENPYQPFASSRPSNISQPRPSDLSQRPPRDMSTPVPPPSPTKNGRTPSILRTLAHHSSLSALKNKSTRKDKKRTAPPLPPVRPSHLTDLPLNENEIRKGPCGIDEGSPGPRKLRKGSLKGSRSVPRGMRLSWDGDDHCDNVLPPLPSHDSAHSFSRGIQRTSTPVHRRVSSTSSTPESLRIRMTLDLAMESPHRRARNSDPCLRTPEKGRSQRSASRNMSSPALPNRLSITPARETSKSALPRTMQHPHPVPLLPDEQYSADYAATTTFFTPGDFVPMTDSGKSLPDGDGLDILVGTHQEVPAGTPGGKKEDLRRGALIDGAKHEKNAIRFFSGDTYGPRASSPSPSPSLPPSAARLVPHSARICSGLPNQSDGRRSASPFEVMLTPNVTKRMSLDAFGTPSPPSTEEVGDPAANVEELVEDEEDEGISEDPQPEEYSSPGEFYQRTHLSTIEEVSYAPPVPFLERSLSAYFTPFSLSAPRNDTSSVPPRHLSAPPINVTQALINAHLEHSKALQVQIKRAELVVEGLKEESRGLCDALEEEGEERRKLSEEMASREKMRQTEDGLQAAQVAEKSHRVIGQLRAALAENEEFFEELQIAHDNLAAQCVELQEERDELLFARHKDAQTLNASLDTRTVLTTELDALHTALKQALEDRQAADAALETLRQVLSEVEAQLEVTAEEYTSHLASHDRELRGITTAAAAKDFLIGQLQDRLRCTADELNSSVLCRDSETKGLKRQVLGKDELIISLREKLSTTRYENDERTVEMAGLRSKVKEVEESERGLKQRLEKAEQESEGFEVVRKNWEHEKEELIELFTRPEGEDSTGLQEQLAEVSAERTHLRRQMDGLLDDYEDARATLDIRTRIVDEQERELRQLRRALADTEDTLSRSTTGTSRRLKDAERESAALQQQLLDLRSELATQQLSLRNSVLEAETQKMTASDLRSRLDAYLSELDRVQLSETSLKGQLADNRQASAGDSLHLSELVKRVKQLEQDKELLNIALDSKQTELALVQRGQRAPSTPKGQARHPPSSTNGTSATRPLSAQQQEQPDITPVPPRLFSASPRPPTTNLRASHAKRESSIFSAPVISAQAPASTSIPRPAGPRQALGSSTAHNRTRTPERRKRETPTSLTLSSSLKKAGLARQTSLPVLKRSSVSVSAAPKVAFDLQEEEEVDEVF